MSKNLGDDVRQGRISLKRVFELFASQQRQFQETRQELEQAGSGSRSWSGN